MPDKAFNRRGAIDFKQPPPLLKMTKQELNSNLLKSPQHKEGLAVWKLEAQQQGPHKQRRNSVNEEGRL